LHWALREVLGEHVKQAGSLVAPDRLRFDFSHYEAVTAAEIRRIEQMANAEVLANSRVAATEMSKQAATEKGAIAFFGDKYGDTVRVLEAGHSLELCGGTHVSATGDIGPIKIVSEGSIGSNLRRIEALTGEHAVRYMLDVTATLASAADVLGAKPDDIVAAIPNPDVVYATTWWRIAEDEVLVIDLTPPDTHYWSLQMCDRWFQCFPDRRSSINNAQAVAEADGSVRIVLSDGDPGVPNWLDTNGHRVGVMFFRWLHADPEVLPTCTVVKRADLS
ncbi:MAG: DUF1254 domain-containing protein, partial [Actinobacteria bacterium]|nr:DUF1254 domain-containing protein [Actinomycetota bacterium]